MTHRKKEIIKDGITPEWFARVLVALFECMAENKSEALTSKTTKAIPVRLYGDVKNSEWDKIKAKFLVVVLKSALENFDHKKFTKVKEAVDLSIALWRRKDVGSEIFKAAAKSAAANACAAANAAYAAAANSYAAAAAYSAACSAAYAAAYAVDNAVANAVDSAAAAAYAAAADGAATAENSAKYDSFADELIKILKAVKE